MQKNYEATYYVSFFSLPLSQLFLRSQKLENYTHSEKEKWDVTERNSVIRKVPYQSRQDKNKNRWCDNVRPTQAS